MNELSKILASKPSQMIDVWKLKYAGMEKKKKKKKKRLYKIGYTSQQASKHSTSIYIGPLSARQYFCLADNGPI